MPRIGKQLLAVQYFTLPLFGGYVASTTAGAVGRVYLRPFAIPHAMIIDRIICTVGGLQAGNLRLGIYREGPTANLPDGGALVVESASTATSATNFVQPVTVADTLLVAGRYWLGSEWDNALSGAHRENDGNSIIARYYNRAGGYGAFTNPCPATTAGTVLLAASLRVKTSLGSVDR